MACLGKGMYEGVSCGKARCNSALGTVEGPRSTKSGFGSLCVMQNAKVGAGDSGAESKPH
jgi:hypothetical protein